MRINALYEQPSVDSYDLLRLKDGRIFERHSRPQWLGNDIVGRVWVFRDVTAQRQIEATLERERTLLRTLVDTMPAIIFAKDSEGRKIPANLGDQRAMGVQSEAEVLGKTDTVSHDLKSPLITIGGFVGFLQRDLLNGNVTQAQEDMARINGALAKMQQLLDELLELSRIGRRMNPPETIPFEAIAREAVELVRGRITAGDVTVEIMPNLPDVYGDRARLVEAVQNLVDNACKYMGNTSHPHVEIGAWQTEAETVFYVRDNGIGIELQYQEKVFGLFDKLDPTSDGAGVGLAIVKRIIEVHGGKIWIEPGNQGTGSTFCFTLSDGTFGMNYGGNA